MAERITSYKDLRVYQSAMEAAMRIFQLTKSLNPRVTTEEETPPG